MHSKNTEPESSANPQQVGTSAAWPGAVPDASTETSEARTEKLLPISKVIDCVGFGSSKIYHLIKQGKFPKPVKVGSSSRWSESAVQNWITQRINESSAMDRGRS